MARVTVTTKSDLRSINILLASLKRPFEGKFRRRWVVVGNRVTQFYKNRYRQRAAGRGSWAALQVSTIERKKRRGVASNPSAILREGDDLLQSLSFRIESDRLRIGFLTRARHPRSKLTKRQLASLHMTLRPLFDTPLPSNVVREVRETLLKG